MSERFVPAIVALIFAIIFTLVLFVPFVAREFRRHGELGIGTSAQSFAALLYVLGLLAYVLIPLPPLVPGFCELYGEVEPQWEPFASLSGVELTPWAVADEAVQQFALNIALFVPLGVLVRRVSGRGTAVTTATGFVVSLAVELTQLTGNWFLYPCPYRLFDVDDLIANSLGALAGACLTPILRLRHRNLNSHPHKVRPVTAARRLLGMCCDALLLWWIGTVLLRTADAVLKPVSITPYARTWLESALLWFAPAGVMLVTTAVLGGSTLGQHAVFLRSVTPAGRRPGPRALLCRWSSGLGGLAAIQGILHATATTSWAMPTTLVWCTVQVFGVTRTVGHQGISGQLAGLHVEDSRQASAGASRSRKSQATTVSEAGWTRAALRPRDHWIRFGQLDPR